MTPQKYPQNLCTQKILFFLKTPKNIEVQNFEPQKTTRAYICKKISEYPPLSWALPLPCCGWPWYMHDPPEMVFVNNHITGRHVVKGVVSCTMGTRKNHLNEMVLLSIQNILSNQMGQKIFHNFTLKNWLTWTSMHCYEMMMNLYPQPYFQCVSCDASGKTLLISHIMFTFAGLIDFIGIKGT